MRVLSQARGHESDVATDERTQRRYAEAPE